MRRRLATPAALAVLVLGLTACSGEDGTGPITEAPSYPNQGSDDGGESPEESDGGGEAEGDEQAAPDIPAPDPADYPGMDENTPEGAEQFARYYVAQLMRGYQTGDSGSLEGLYSEECATCVNNRDLIDDYRERGEYWSPVDTEDAVIEATEDTDYDYVVGYGLIISPHTEPDLNAGAPEEFPNMRYSMAIGLNWGGESWVVEGMFVEALEE